MDRPGAGWRSKQAGQGDKQPTSRQCKLKRGCETHRKKGPALRTSMLTVAIVTWRPRGTRSNTCQEPAGQGGQRAHTPCHHEKGCTAVSSNLRNCNDLIRSELRRHASGRDRMEGLPHTSIQKACMKGSAILQELQPM
jgi:hypothetical protein